MTLEIGQIIDAKYRVVRRIGEGGMGTVYEGENSRIGRRVAIKVLHAQVAAMPDFVERFEREARAAARIGSPHVCDVLDLGDLPGGDRYIVMEYLDGTSFEDRLAERGKLTTSQLAPIAFELLEGLATMHDARVIHRDLKPANVFLARTPGGRGEKVKILDFGVAKLQPFAGEVGTMTQTGTMMGTPLYMSPEQARGARDVDARTDIYAASVMFYRALTGVLPYNADTLNELLFKIVLEDPKPLRELAPEVDETFAELVHKGLARDLNQRFETARAYQEAIASWGQAQGRASLSFAVTIPSEPPPAPSVSSEAAVLAAAPTSPVGKTEGGGVVGVAAAVTGASAGTPLAWADGAASEKPVNSSRQAAATVLTALSEDEQRGVSSSVPSAAPARDAAAPASSLAPPQPPAKAAAIDAGASAGTSSGASAELATTGATKTSAEADVPEIAKATTTPGAPAADVVRATAPASKAEPRSPRNAILGIVAAGAVAIVAIFAFGRGDGNRPAPAGMTPVTSSAAPTADPPPEVAPSATAVTAAGTSTAGSGTTLVALGVDAAAAAVVTAPAASATSDASRESAAASARPASGRKTEPPATAPTTPSTASTSSRATTAATTGASPTSPTSPAPSASTPKPASSARKFRTNID
jgi:serine/threonine-protein kinase